MELLNVAQARSIWIIETADLNPRGKNLFLPLSEWLKNTYKFTELPSIGDLEGQKGLQYKQGIFQREDGVEIGIQFTVFQDGFVAESRSSTKDSDAFISDVLTKSTREFSLPFRPDLIQRKQYLSELVIKLKYPMSNLNPKLQRIAARLSSLRPDLPPHEFSAVEFAMDSTKTTTKATGFVIERRINTDFSAGRYYSRAPVGTDDHLSLVEDFEAALATPSQSPEDLGIKCSR
jgi:hypothetical protein